MIGELRVLDGSTFMLSRLNGDVDLTPDSPNGLISLDTRFISKWVLTVNGQRLRMLSVNQLQYFHVRIAAVPERATLYLDTNLSVVRSRKLAAGCLEEEVTLVNHCDQPLEAHVRLEIDADFADLSEPRRLIPTERPCVRGVDERNLYFCHRRESFQRLTAITSTAPAEVDSEGFSFVALVPPHEEWSTRITVRPRAIALDGVDIVSDLAGPAVPEFQKLVDLRKWIGDAPVVNSTPEALAKIYQRSLVDLAALRYQPLMLGEGYLIAAGLPWFMTARSRDSIFVALQALPFAPSLAMATLRTLAISQGTGYDDFRDEDPGRMILEFRYGELAAFEERPHSPYYGCVDATPLFVVLLDEYERWTGDHELVRLLEPEVRAALTWIDTCADLMGDGYLWYETRNPHSGLVNQGWKDAPLAISYHDGRLPGFPRTTCELQGYAYDAKRRAARLARLYWDDPEYADRLEREASELKDRFNRDFWIEDGEFYALGLDGERGERIDALASNMGHLLWSGIVPEDRAKKVAGHLMDPKLFSGWGVRTLARGEDRYNPLGLHVGTIWPFDNAIIAWGLRRYGFDREAGRIAKGILDAAEHFDGRLPEAFAGFDRDDTEYPIEYPGACSPHAMSAGTPLLLIRTMLGLEPFGPHLALRPALPAGIGRLEVLNIPGRWGKRDAFARGLLSYEE
ncbi:MAG TPA: glycogen debranching N-terminal domain-containing protein [Micromonosporaceae bacterium]